MDLKLKPETVLASLSPSPSEPGWYAQICTCFIPLSPFPLGIVYLFAIGNWHSPGLVAEPKYPS